MAQHPRTFRQFGSDARLAIREAAPSVRTRLANSSLPPGTWHPYGFASFLLEDAGKAGQLVLRAWPANLRRGIPGTPTLHCHRFDLMSYVLAGTYTDRMYTVKSKGTASDVPFRMDDRGAPGERRTERGKGTVIGRQFNLGGGVFKEIAPPDHSVETWLELEGGAQRKVTKDRFHAIPAGSFHATGLPVSSTCLTLCFIRYREDAYDMCVGRPDFKVDSSPRLHVTPNEIEYICSQATEGRLSFGPTDGVARSS